MKRSKLALAATSGLVGLSLLAGVAARAESHGKANDATEVQQFLGAKVAIADAVKAAEGATGGKAVSAEFDSDKAGAYFDVETLSGDKYQDVKVSATDGKVLGTTEDKAEAGDKSDANELAALGQMKMTLTDVIAKAEKESGGKVMAVGYSSEDEGNATAIIEIEVAKADGTTQALAMNPADGTLKAVAGHEQNGDNDDAGEEGENDNG